MTDTIETLTAERDRMKSSLAGIVRYCRANKESAAYVQTVGVHYLLDRLDEIGHRAEAALLPAPKQEPTVSVEVGGEVYTGRVTDVLPVLDKPEWVTIQVEKVGLGDCNIVVTGPIVEGE